MRYLLAGLAGLALFATTGCLGRDEVTWDFTEPTTGTELGGPNEWNANIGGPGPITVRFPQGQTIEFDDFRRADANIGGGQFSGSIDQVQIWYVTAGSADDVRAVATDFTERWGSTRNVNGETLDDFVADLDDDTDEDIPFERLVFFGASPNGLLPGFRISTSEGRFAASASFDFDP